MRILLSLVLLAAFFSNGCRSSSNGNAPAPQQGQNPPAQQGPKKETEISGSYCTLWTQGTWVKTNDIPPMTLVCLQDNGKWIRIGGFSEDQRLGFDNDGFYFGSLNRAQNGDPILAYTRTLSPDNEANYMVARFHQGQGWNVLGNGPANMSDGGPLSANTQFGGQFLNSKVRFTFFGVNLKRLCSALW